MRPSSTPISFWNYVNLLTYFVNAAIVYSVGLYGALGKGNNAVISAKYQTLITPARFTFVIWAVIYLCQLVWAVSQVVSPQYRVKALQYVHNYNYVLVCVAQMAWTFAFGLQVLWLSLVFMVLTLILLMRLIYQARTVQSQQDEESGWSDYFLYQFPFNIHAGWITAAALVNANVVLVAYHYNHNVQVFAALLSLALVLMAATFFLSLPDFIIPLVLIWALVSAINDGHAVGSSLHTIVLTLFIFSVVFSLAYTRSSVLPMIRFAPSSPIKRLKWSRWRLPLPFWLSR